MAAAFKIQQGTELVAAEDVFLTADYATKGDKTVVGASDPRAAILLARKGSPIPERLAKQLGITKDSELSIAAAAPVVEKTISPEDISSRETRPEKPASKR